MHCRGQISVTHRGVTSFDSLFLGLLAVKLVFLVCNSGS
uniref:Uncharacterized protein n=1 Tax=Rhizophora mucronata TaxID=61149 RepID=A0A2P2QS23_RHIMU